MIRLAFQKGHSGGLWRMCWRQRESWLPKNGPYRTHILQGYDKRLILFICNEMLQINKKKTSREMGKEHEQPVHRKEILKAFKQVKKSLDLIHNERYENEIYNQTIRQGHVFRPSIGKGRHFDTILCWGG